MRKEEIKRQWRIIFQASLIFYLGFTVFGIIPLVTLESVIWERNFFFIALGLILGLIMFVGFIVMMMTMLLSMWPSIRKFDYLYIVIMILSLVMVDLTMSEELMFSEYTTMGIFLVIAMITITLQLIARAMIEKTVEEDLQAKWARSLSKLPKPDPSTKNDVVKSIMTILVVVVFVAMNDFGNLTDRLVTFLVIFVLGVYVVRLYHKTYALPKGQRVFDIVFFSIAYSGVIIILSYLSDFFVMHTILKSLMVLLPFGPFLWVIMPHLYIITWTEKDKTIKQEQE